MRNGEMGVKLCKRWLGGLDPSVRKRRNKSAKSEVVRVVGIRM